MQKRLFYIVVVVLATVLKGYAQPGSSNIEFVENKGQWDARVKFRGELSNGAMFLEKKGYSAMLYNPDDLKRMTEAHHGISSTGGGPFHGAGAKVVDGGKGAGTTGGSTTGLRAHAYRVSFTDASDNVTVLPDKILPGYNNYFIGNDPSKWAGDCRVFQGVTYKNLYPNIDIRYYTNDGQLKYDIIVHPGGDYHRIRMKYEGADRLSVKKNQLVVGTSVGAVTQLAPYSYLYDQQGRKDIKCRYVVRDGNTVSFDLPDYDPGATLIIDPTVIFSSFSGSKVSNWGFTATPGQDGSFFLGGIVFGSAFPFTTGAFEPVYGGGSFDVGILKLNTSGTSKVYATYLGGSATETPHSLFCDGQGNLVVLGRTYSNDFPVKSAAGSPGGADMFVARISPSGNTLLGSMRIGGSKNDCVNMEDQAAQTPANERADSLIRNYGDDSRSEVVVDGQGNILVAASTQSADFPIVGPVFQPNFGGGRQDGVVLKIDPSCNHIIWSSFLGGTRLDAAFVLKTNPITGDIYVGGATSSPDLPASTKGGVIQAGYGGGSSDGFVAQISSDGTLLIRSTYLGTTYGDAIYGLQFDKKGFLYVMGTTNGTWTVTNVKYFTGGGRQFVSKLKPDLSAYVYSTTFGTPSGLPNGKPNISPVAFLVDRCENVYVSGWGGWIFGTGSDPYGWAGTAGMATTPDAYKRLSDNRDFYFIVLKKNCDTILYGTFFGENDNSTSISEHVDGGTSRYDQNGVIYQAICANCSGPNATGRYPTTPGVWAPVNAAAVGCNMAGLKIAFNFAGVAAGLQVSVNGRRNDTAGCIPMDTYLQDTIRNAKQYIFNFGDGSPDTATTSYSVMHTYVNAGTYRVMMVAIDSNSCNVADTVYRHVIARTDKAPVDFSIAKALGVDCQLLEYTFTNLSTAPPSKPFGPQSFVWDFGDGSPQLTTGFGVVNHSYGGPGTYLVNLILVDTNYCNYPDTATKMLRVSPTAKAQFVTPSTGCAPYSAVFNNTSLGGTLFQWDFGDPASGDNTSSEVNPVHLYQNPGTYTIKLHEEDPNTCNKVSDTSFTITIYRKSRAAFTFAPAPPVANVPIVFTNGSEEGVKFIWSFGDGDTVVKTTPDTVQHLYIATDSFPVCLVTINQYGCADTVCHTVASLINPLLDVPNAFTPGRFGQNAVLKVMGFGILHMDFRIYNRWGKMVFTSDNPNVGWDGTYLGVLQPMDVYAYTLEAQFSDGKHVSKKGDITLVR